jgi:hypothetical protein
MALCVVSSSVCRSKAFFLSHKSDDIPAQPSPVTRPCTSWVTQKGIHMTRTLVIRFKGITPPPAFWIPEHFSTLADSVAYRANRPPAQMVFDRRTTATEVRRTRTDEAPSIVEALQLRLNEVHVQAYEKPSRDKPRLVVKRDLVFTYGEGPLFEPAQSANETSSREKFLAAFNRWMKKTFNRSWHSVDVWDGIQGVVLNVEHPAKLDLADPVPPLYHYLTTPASIPVSSSS